jgi:hypothetical protein
MTITWKHKLYPAREARDLTLYYIELTKQLLIHL